MHKSIASVMLLLCAVFAFFAVSACGDSVEADEDVATTQEESSSSVKSSSSKAKSSSSSKAKSSSSSAKNSSSSKLEYPDSFKPQDKEYPYAGVPRVVIETEYRQAINDRETEIPAKLQIWGENESESEIMDLTIRGRGNSSWSYPKKPYAIKFETKQSFLGMAEAKKWVMLANYRDRTLIRNAVAFELARKTSLEWTPSGKFVDVILNGEFQGNYYICEKIEVKKNRLNLNEDSFLLEFDKNPSDDIKFKTLYNDLPVNIKYPKEADSVQLGNIKDFVDSAEKKLQLDSNDVAYLDYIEQNSFAAYFIVNALSTNTEILNPKSVYMYKNNDGKLTAGPVWDFDYATFVLNKSFSPIKKSTMFENFFNKTSFKSSVQKEWNENKNALKEIDSFIDSLSDYIKLSNEQNIKLWPIKINVDKAGDEEKDFDEAIDLMKKGLRKKMNEIDNYASSI